MNAFFIDPSKLPGGEKWTQACDSIPSNASSQATALLRSSLQCDASTLGGFIQVISLLLVYGVILYSASSLIADGSELLLLIKGFENVVGSVVLPILGAVPDGAIVLFSGLRENAQEEVAIGVGALAGSTILLLTLPWFAAVYSGRVNLRADGRSTYIYRPRLWPPNYSHLTRTGVEPKGMVREAGRFMLITCVSYIIIQGYALFSGNSFTSQQTSQSVQLTAQREHNPAIVVLVVCLGLFTLYIWTQFNGSPDADEYRESVVEKVTVRAIQEQSISISCAFNDLGQLVMANEHTSLVGDKRRLDNVLKVFFREFDCDKNGYIDEKELAHLMSDLGERLSIEDLRLLQNWIDADADGQISMNEFIDAMPKFIRHRTNQGVSAPPALRSMLSRMENGRSNVNSNSLITSSRVGGQAQVEDHHGDVEEVPEDLRSNDPATQRRKILVRSFSMMTIGTVLVLTFSDPCVGVMNDMASRMEISGFYIAFILAPVASNFSEVVAACSYAQKKTRRTITVSFTTLLGAAILNNTFVLAIFMILIVVKGIAWQFTAETLSILFVEIVLGIMSQKRVQTLRDGFIVLSLYPLSLLLVFALTNLVGLD